MSHAGGLCLQYRMSKSDNFAIYNLGSAATLVTGSIVSGDGTPYLSQNNAYLNLHGGTLKPATNETNFIRTSLTGSNAALAAPQAVVYSEGAVIDTNGHSITIRQPLRAPAGNGVPAATIPLSSASQGSGYTTTPIVYVTTNAAAEPSSGCANGATAVANMVDDGTGRARSSWPRSRSRTLVRTLRRRRSCRCGAGRRPWRQTCRGSRSRPLPTSPAD